MHLRDHVLAQLDLADACPRTPDGEAERRQRLTVVAVGTGYTGTEFVAQMQRWLTTVADRWDRTGPDDVRWVLVEVMKAVLPELGPGLGAAALKVLADRGADVRLGVTVKSTTADSVELTRGYHHYALPGATAKVRAAVDWLLTAALPAQVVHVSDLRESDAPIRTAQATGIYGRPEPRTLSR